MADIDTGRPVHAMVLAAGLGTRMRPLSTALPKPLVTVGGRALIDHVLDRMDDYAVALAVVNAHFLADRLAAHLAGRARPPVRVLREPALLGTGGGVANALEHLAPAGTEVPFFVANADALWRDGPRPALDRLAAAWRPAAMDALLLLTPRDGAGAANAAGDFHRGGEGRLTRPAAGRPAPYLYAGVQLVHRRLFAGAPTAGAFSINPLWDRAGGAGRLYGLVHDGGWFHVGTPAAVAVAEAALAAAPVGTGAG